MLQKDNVRLRPVKRSDLKAFVKWVNDREVAQFISQDFPVTEMAEERWIEEIGKKGKTDASFVIEVLNKKAWRKIGCCSLSNFHPVNHSATFGIFIGEKSNWSQGIGTKCLALLLEYGFEQLNLHRIGSSAISFNQRSIGLHLKLGFLEEGRSKETIFKNGQWHDLVLLGILRKNWLKNNKK